MPQPPPSDESAADREFRAEARAFLEAHAKPRDTTADLATTLGRTDISPEAEAEHVQECRDWQATLTANGWAGIAWPKEYGGRGGTPSQAKIFAQEEHDFVVSSAARSPVAIGMVGPTIIAHGTEEQKDFFLPRMLNGEQIWCQLFSRARRRIRPRRAHDTRRARRRRVGRQRPEGVDVGRALQRLGDPARPHRLGRAEAPRHQLLPRRHALARHRHPAAAPDHRLRALQRGLPHRRAHPREERAR